ncbi:MAG: hypothetical protein HOA57_01090 [Candidatus Magasanikbacteria bacterium]|jgi:hypothetical protein|nr:hypothetical protein [Candidatus Magasanikbacteria bacterium]MBT4315018.1 hypothetical protein [Candidatus Magasanikbacteria bacterium]MBT4546797.1 hypothetical protein [Candidatus Magasanikbacteria bacterium]MBT6818962.1 hypothetical protein [Candidatus Magasanikbacteria bacterium]
MENKKQKWQLRVIIVLSVLLTASFLIMGMMSFGHILMGEMDMEGQRLSFLEQRDSIISKLIAQGDYACCLVTPCTYCIEKTPGHGEGATCSCLEDIVNGVHPCGECIGEILEGHGNKYLKKYFAPAIAEEVGLEHLEEIQKIIDEKYKVST